MKRMLGEKWYPVSFLGLVLTVLYGLVPPYIAYAQSTDSLPGAFQLPLITAMIFIAFCMVLCRLTEQKPFHKKRRK